MNSKSQNNTLTRVTIQEYSSDYGYKMLMDTLINEAKTFFFFEYSTPTLSANQEVRLLAFLTRLYK